MEINSVLTSYNFFEIVKSFLFILLVSLSASINAQQKVIELYNGAAPGSENWNWDEKENYNKQFDMEVVYNVSHPSLAVFFPDTSIANGTSVIICPGGAWHMIAIENEGYKVARWLNKRGVAAFVLKYRTIHVLTDDPIKETMSKYPNDSGSVKLNEENKPAIALAIADGKAAITYVRQHAAEFRIAEDRIGIMGGSSGGAIAAAIAYDHTAENRPDFVAPLYTYLGGITKSAVPNDAPPMFIAVATDDQIGFNIPCVDLYKEWAISKHSVELHVYSKGGHGLRGFPADTWIDRFADWLDVQGLLKPKQ